MKEFKVRPNSTGPKALSMLPLLSTEQYQAQQKEENQLVLALLADTEGMLAYNAACVPCLFILA